MKRRKIAFQFIEIKVFRFFIASILLGMVNGGKEFVYIYIGGSDV